MAIRIFFTLFFSFFLFLSFFLLPLYAFVSIIPEIRCSNVSHMNGMRLRLPALNTMTSVNDTRNWYMFGSWHKFYLNLYERHTYPIVGVANGNVNCVNRWRWWQHSIRTAISWPIIVLSMAAHGKDSPKFIQSINCEWNGDKFMQKIGSSPGHVLFCFLFF